MGYARKDVPFYRIDGTYFIWWKTKKTAIYIKLTSIDAEIDASKKKSHN